MVKKAKKIKTNVYNDSESVIKKFVVLSVVMVVIVVMGYFLTAKLVDNRKEDNTSNTTNVTVDYSKVSVGTLLNRPYDEYLVMVYNGEDKDAVYYSTLITGYQSDKEKGKIYFCDLANKLNSDYASEDGSTLTKGDSVEGLRFGKVTLLKVKNGKIVASYENIDEIKKVLK